jgi:hypothetical protein
VLFSTHRRSALSGRPSEITGFQKTFRLIGDNLDMFVGCLGALSVFGLSLLLAMPVVAAIPDPEAQSTS